MRRLATVWLLLMFVSTIAVAKDMRFSPAQVEALLDEGQVDAALKSLDQHLKKAPRDAKALLLRSTAHIMDGDLVAGRHDLTACLDVDPTIRQAWLNRAALDLAEADYAAAVDADTLAQPDRVKFTRNIPTGPLRC